MIKRKITRFEQPLKVYSSILVDKGAITRQTYNVATGEYYPDRALIPLVLTPQIGYYLNDAVDVVENAAAELINGHWYRLDTNTSGKDLSAAEITDGADYKIDSKIGSSTYGQLEIKRNTLAGNPETYLFRATLNRNGGVAVSATFRVSCDKIERLPELYFDNNTQALYNPWDTSGIKRFAINPKLTSDDYPVKYKWQYQNDGVWADLGTLPEHWAVEENGNGVIIDRTHMPEEIVLKCIATISISGVGVTIEKIVTHRRRLPAFEYEIAYIGDVKEDVRSIYPRALIRTGSNVIEDVEREVTVNWFGEDDGVMATGMNPQIALSNLGADMELGLEVRDAGGYKLLKSRDGSYFTANDGAYFLLK